jgi:hypothetical protein
MSNEPTKTPKQPVRREQPIEVTGIVLQVGPGGNRDYIPFGSEGHAFILNLRVAEDGDLIRQTDKSGREWTLTDITAFPAGTTEAYLKAILAERLRILQTVPTIPPGAPELWMPDEAISGITGVS